jgi:hypothetical protein
MNRQRAVFLALVVLGLVFFLHNTTLRLADDDVGWLRGEAPTVFDQYRQIPHFFFISLHALFGPSAPAALAMIWLFHCLNALLLYRLAQRLLADSLAALIAAAVFLINPLTLKTLTWISCFSYVLGATLALLALLAFCHTSNPPAALRASLPSPISKLQPLLPLLCFTAGLFCTHEILFLPVLFLVLGWLQGRLKQGVVHFGAGMVIALLVNAFVYDFGRYGVEASRLFSLDFALAYTSSGLASGLALGLAYPLSFFAKTIDFLRFCFSEPVRWSMTTVLLAIGVLFGTHSKAWRLILTLALSFLALITPYIIRLYLTPDTVNFDISYVLSGRVFYLPFIAIALAGGLAVSWLCRPLQGRRWAWLALLLPAAAYGHALWLYDQADFLGLNVAHTLAQPMPPRWNPYLGQHPAWLALAGLALILCAALRLLVARKRRRQPCPT